MRRLKIIRVVAVCAAFAASLGATAGASAFDLRDRRIAYALTDMKWAVYQTDDGKAECPNGYNVGPREEFKALFPDTGEKRTLVDTQLKREIAVWFPKPDDPHLPYKDVKGSISYGLNLDGKDSPEDFVDPDGNRGIDNQLYRATGCTPGFRAPDGFINFFNSKYIRLYNYNRVLLELTEVDSLQNDNAVDVTMYRGLDKLLTDATGNKIMPGGSQRIDQRFGGRVIQHMKGRIVDGVLLTDPTDIVWPMARAHRVPGTELIRGLQLKLKLTAEDAEGMVAGYSDIAHLYDRFIRSWSTHHMAYGHLSTQSFKQAITRLADGYPDPKTGANTAISSAMTAWFSQVFILRDEEVQSAKN